MTCPRCVELEARLELAERRHAANLAVLKEAVAEHRAAPKEAPTSVGSAAWDRVERAWRMAFQYGVEACARRVESTTCSAGLKPVMLGTALDLRSTFDILGEDGLPLIRHAISPPAPSPDAQERCPECDGTGVCACGSETCRTCWTCGGTGRTSEVTK